MKNKLSKLCKEFFKENFNIKLVATSFKIQNYFSYKNPISDDLKSSLVYKFTCASCSSSYIGETYCHFKTWIEEHIIKDDKSYISKHPHSTATCFDKYNSLSYKIIDKATFKFDLKIEEALHINWKKPNLNAQQNHLAFTLSLWLLSPLFFSVFVFFMRFSFIFYFHYLWHKLLESFTVLITLRYYFISLQHTLYHTFSFIYYFHYLYANYRHLLLS